MLVNVTKCSSHMKKQCTVLVVLMYLFHVLHTAISSCICIRRWPSGKRGPIGLANFICLSTGECQGQDVRVGGGGEWGERRIWETFGIALEM
jgi:hypothetical protein